MTAPLAARVERRRFVHFGTGEPMLGVETDADEALEQVPGPPDRCARVEATRPASATLRSSYSSINTVATLLSPPLSSGRLAMSSNVTSGVDTRIVPVGELTVVVANCDTPC